MPLRNDTAMNEKGLLLDRTTFRAATLFLGMAWVLSGCSGSSSPATPSVGQGEKATAAYLAAQVDWAGMEAFWKRSGQLRGIYTGPSNSTKHMLVYFDPNCPVCARQWEILEPYLGTVRIQWIPIGYMSKSSTERAAAILAAPDPASALADNERRYDFDRQLGGFAPSTTAPDWAVRAVKTNTRQAMRTGDAPGTPAIGFELYNGKRYFRMFGLVDGASMSVAVGELGYTMDPWKHPQRAHQADSAPGSR